MKRILFSFIISFLFLSACQKNDLNENKTWDYVPAGSSLLKFLNSYTALTPSLATPANGPTVDYYVNNLKLNATAIGYTTLYPNVSGAFAAAPNNVVNIKAVLNRAVGTPGLPSDTIANYNFTLAPEKAHSVILVDPLPNPTPANPNLMVIQESVTMPAYGKYKIRLLNLVVNTDLYELYNSTTAAILTTGIPYKNLSDWIELPLTTTSQTIQLRKVGTTTSLGSVVLTPGNQRSYTFWARGNTAVTGRAISLSSYITQ
jgi:hypothetical protein